MEKADVVKGVAFGLTLYCDGPYRQLSLAELDLKQSDISRQSNFQAGSNKKSLLYTRRKFYYPGQGRQRASTVLHIKCICLRSGKK